jgi:DNA-binding CsgD family transcriptional regulator
MSRPLTLRERQVLAALAEGLSTKQVAAQLGVSRWTVRDHLASASLKLGARTATQAVVIAVERGVLVA